MITDTPKFLDHKRKLLVLDVDNTLFDWVSYYAPSLWAMLSEVERVTSIPIDSLAEAAQDVFRRHGSIEYPFLIQELPEVLDWYGDKIDEMLSQLVEPARKLFLEEAKSRLKPYPGVHDTLKAIKEKNPGIGVVALTDAPRYIAMWKLNKLGLLPFFDAVYGLPDPVIPTCTKTRRVKVSPGILLKHLQQHDFGFEGRIRVLPDDYEKPGSKGLRTVLMDFESDSFGEDKWQNEVWWVGDNLRKDIGLGRSVGVFSVWARYGASPKEQDLELLHRFSPQENIARHASLDPASSESPKPDLTIDTFEQLL